MAFIPKNRYEILYTNGKELYNPKTKQEYKGDYIKTGNLYYAGKSISKLGDRLQKIDQGGGNLSRKFDAQVYHSLRPSRYKKALKRKAPPSTFIFPGQTDYDKGFFTRYFCRRKNSKSGFYEISEESFDNLNKGRLNNTLYLGGLIVWSLTDSKVNKESILRLESTYPGIRFFFNDDSQFLRKPQEDLTAGKNELFYLDGNPYPEGAKYHIHPEKGPMEGAFHINEPHLLLTFDRPTLPDNEPESDNQPVTPTPTPPSTPTITPSYGGGGGY